MIHDPLKYQRNQLIAAEAGLNVARDNLRAALKRQGLPTDGIFSETEFVLRSTAERWSYEAEREGREKGFKSTLEAFKHLIAAGVLCRGDPKNSPFSGVKLDLDGPATSAAHAMVRAFVAAHNERRGEKSEPTPRAAPKLTPQRRKVSI
jgi:hypothetical protein